MQELKVTTPGEDGHYHIVYLNSLTGAGAMSPGADGHTHDVIYEPPQEPTPAQQEIPPQIDPSTGEVAIDPSTGEPDPGTPAAPATPGTPGTWVVRPAGESQNGEVPTNGLPMVAPDMHTHELMEYRTKPVETQQSDKEVLAECMALWREGLAITCDSRKKGRESEDFYAGKQWDDTVSRSLNQLDRAALTINEIASNIDTLLGYQIEQRTDLKYLPQEGGDQRVADMLNIVSKRILDSCYFPREESKVFKDITIPGLGVFNIYMDFEKDIQGTPIVERFPWDDIVYGPHEKEDLSDCEYEVRSRMFSIAKLKQLFGKKADKIEESFGHYIGQYPDASRNDNGVDGTNTDYRYAKKLDDGPTYTIDGTMPLVDVQKKQFRLAQCTRKTYKEVTVVFNQAENYFFTAYDWKPKDIEKAATIPGFQAITQTKTRMRITKFCAGVVLADENPAELPMHDFYTVPVYGYRQNGEFWGKVEAVKDPQRELNKRRSQAMDTMNRLGASVYYVENETFKDNNEQERFKKNRSKPGSIFQVNDLGRTPKLESGAEFPAPLVNIMQMDQQNLQRLMNVVIPQGGADTSGAAFMAQKQNRLTGNQFLLDNLSFAKQKLGKILLALIQKYYSSERIQRLLNASYTREAFKVGGEDYATFTPEEITEMLDNTDLMEYDVVVSESSFAPSTRLGIAKVLFDLIQKGAQIPPELALQFIDMPADTRAKISETLQQQTEQAVQEATDKGNAEVIKTLIAKGQYTVTPEKAQELGLVPAGQENMASTNAAQSPNNEDNSQATEYANNLASSLAGG